MKKSLKSLICITATLLMATSVYAAKTELYALDGRTIFVDENQIEAYTAEGMGWYLEKPVTMYALDGRSLVVAADQVEAHKAVGWHLENELPKESEDTQSDAEIEAPVVKEEKPEVPLTVRIKYTDGTIIAVPAEHLKMYLALDWVEVDGESATSEFVTMYNEDGISKQVPVGEVSKYELAGWSVKSPEKEYMTVYSYDGETKEIAKDMYDSYMAEGWYSAYDEAVYAYAAFGDGKDVLGAVKLLEDKRYELAFNMVKDAIDKIEDTQSEYVTMLYYLRTSITDAWREAANSPLGFINYWFTDRGEKKFVIFEYRNISNSRIKYFEINFDICDAEGKVIETNSGSYFVDNLQLVPCDKTRVGWEAKSGKDAASITNVKVKEVRFSDGTVWKAAK